MLKSLYYAAGAGLAAVESRLNLGRNIYQDDWDICIVLDSARADLFASVAADHPLVDAEASAWSVGSVTTEWLTNTFSRDYAAEIADTTLISATPHTQTVFEDRHWLTSQEASPIPYPANPAVDLDAFDAVHELWRTQTDEHNVVAPSTMLDATLDAWDSDATRIVSHWMQPHEPFIAPSARLLGGGATEKNVWQGLQNGDLSKQDVWQSYRATLEYAFDWLDELLCNVDAKVLITADHGNAFGEVGLYGHPFGWPQPAVRRVPWSLVDATATGDYQYQSVLEKEGDGDRDAQLAALGYL